MNNPLRCPLTWRALITILLLGCAVACRSTASDEQAVLQTVGNPFLPLWEHIPDGEPYLFEDPDNAGKYRLYLYGSHDSRRDDYCGRELVLWSAPAEDLHHWRYDGEILRVDRGRQGELLHPEGLADILYAPDVAEVTAPDGTKTYYLYPNDQADGRQSLVAKSSRPDGPFEICNWSTEQADRTEGILNFDPAVFVDEDGRVYGYWGFKRSYAAELDPATMATLKAGCEIIEDVVTNPKGGGDFRFYEASSMRKVKDKYIFIYSRWTHEGEFGMPTSNYTLAYAYGDHPLGPFTYGGTIIDARGRETDQDGRPIASATVTGNTHGSICEVNGQWYVFYHRQTGKNEFARQAMVAPITLTVEEGRGGKVFISEGEYTSEGFSPEGLDPTERHSAGIACWHTGPKPAIHGWPEKQLFGSYVAPSYGTEDRFDAPYALHNNTNAVVYNTDGSIVGYKYFNFTKTHRQRDLHLSLNLIPEGVAGEISIMLDRPWTTQGGVELGRIRLEADRTQNPTEIKVALPHLAEVSGKHALYFVFTSPVKERSICTLLDFAIRAEEH